MTKFSANTVWRNSFNDWQGLCAAVRSWRRAIHCEKKIQIIHCMKCNEAKITHDDWKQDSCNVLKAPPRGLFFLSLFAAQNLPPDLCVHLGQKDRISISTNNSTVRDFYPPGCFQFDAPYFCRNILSTFAWLRCSVVSVSSEDDKLSAASIWNERKKRKISITIEKVDTNFLLIIIHAGKHFLNRGWR